jgi:Capsule polysaccharide biosynthesis protein
MERVRRAVRGTAQWVSRRRVTEPALPRLALSNWTSALGGGDVRRRVMVTAFRNQTWIEWAVYAACQLRRLGVATTLVYSSSELKRLYPLLRVVGLDQLGFWAGVEGIPQIRLIDLDHWRPRPAEGEAYRDFARDFAPTVAAYDLRVEESEEGPLRPAYERALVRAEALLVETGAALERVLAVNPVSRLVCYSGLIGSSPALCEAARRAGVEVLTVEGWAWRPGHMICNLNAPALEYNVLGWLRAAGAWNSAREHESERLFRFQEGALAEGEAPPGNLHRVQRQARSAPLPPSVASFLERPGPRFLLATNVVGDSSTLRRRSIFRSQRDWLRQAIERFRDHADWNLIVRAHPDEAWVGDKAVVRMGEVAQTLAAGLPNVLVIRGEEDVSSYALMPGLSAGLVWISSIGADMVARGIPVLAAARPKYHALGLVDEPRTASDYFDSVEWLASHRARSTPEQRMRARQYLDVVFSQFSFDAFSPSYRARDLFLEGPESPPDTEVFYRIVAGDLPPETPPRRESRQVA